MPIPTIEELRETVAVLRDDIEHLEARLQGIKCELSQDSAERVLNVKYRLLTEQRDMLERAESSSAYEAAQDRWKQHEADDTLDLY